MTLSWEVTAAAESLLSESLGERARIDWGRTVPGYPHVHRGCAEIASRSAPLRIILKFPQRPERWPRLCNDWAGSRFLHAPHGAERISPHPFGHGANLRFTLSEEARGVC